MIETLLFILAALLCFVGLLLSMLAFSGTWLVLAAALITKLAVDFPGIGTLVVFALLCISAEALEALSGFLGVQKRGGSRFAGLAAIFGGVAGAVIGTPVFPILGTVGGLLLGSFASAFLVEYGRLKRSPHASHIAFGAVWARLAVMLLKTVLTLGMSLWLLIGLLLGS